MQTNTNIIKQQKPLRSKQDDTRERNKQKAKRERDSQRASKRIFAFA